MEQQNNVNKKEIDKKKQEENYNAFIDMMALMIQKYGQAVLDKLDKYANKLHINRSAAITSLLVQGLEQSTAIEIMSKLMDKYETLEQLKSVSNDDF